MNLLDGITSGDRRAIARCISLIEDRAPEARQLLAALHPRTGRAHIIGITGPPGTGKSTLVNALARGYRMRGTSIGIIAVDPTSPFSGGALLGDRIRMRELAGDAGVFVRSMATRGSLGGLADATADAAKVLDAAGYDKIVIETVGVGQAEVDIAQATHTTVVLQVPNLGDDIQAMKAGLIEIADIFCVNKADREGADRVALDLRAILDLAPAGSRGRETLDGAWKVPVLLTVATRREGIEPLLAALEDHRRHLDESGQWMARVLARASLELSHLVRGGLMAHLERQVSRSRMAEMVERVARRELDPYAAAAELLRAVGLGDQLDSPGP